MGPPGEVKFGHKPTKLVADVFPDTSELFLIREEPGKLAFSPNRIRRQVQTKTQEPGEPIEGLFAKRSIIIASLDQGGHAIHERTDRNISEIVGRELEPKVSVDGGNYRLPHIITTSGEGSAHPFSKPFSPDAIA
jgi:hypothetical protein